MPAFFERKMEPWIIPQMDGCLTEGGTFRIPHGEANAVFIPVAMKYRSPFQSNKVGTNNEEQSEPGIRTQIPRLGTAPICLLYALRFVQ
jgi:hypothetical protein